MRAVEERSLFRALAEFTRLRKERFRDARAEPIPGDDLIRLSGYMHAMRIIVSRLAALKEAVFLAGERDSRASVDSVLHGFHWT